jgi:hypothetical protein
MRGLFNWNFAWRSGQVSVGSNLQKKALYKEYSLYNALVFRYYRSYL